MLDAIRNLGILKMIQEFPDEFDYNALESIESFLEQREKAIQKGIYGKLQFEIVEDEKIGVFAIEGEEIHFNVKEKEDDSSKYIFRKTPGSQSSYISPTWKAAKSNKKLESTIGSFKQYAKNSNNIFSKLIRVFESNDINLEEDGKITKNDFISIYNKKKNSDSNKKGLNVFTIIIDDKYPGDIKEILEYALNKIAEDFYSSSNIKSTNGKCSICNKENKVFANVLSGVGINISNIDKPGFFPGIDKSNAHKAFPICTPCAEALFVAKSQVFPKFTQLFSGHNTLIIPHLVQSENKKEGLEIIEYALNLLDMNVDNAKSTEAGIIEDLAENKGIATVSFLFGEVSGQSIQNIRKILPDVLPSRLSEIAKAIHTINLVNYNYPQNYSWKLKLNPLDGELKIIRTVLGMAKYNKPPKGKRKPFKAASIDSLDILESIFMRKKFPLKAILPEFSAKLSYDFLGAFSDEKQEPVSVIRNNIAHMVYLLKFLDKLEVIKMTANVNMVSKYLEGSNGLEPLNKFLNEEATGLDNAEKQYAFLVGLLFGKLIAFQQARRVSNNALRWLKGLEIGQQDLMEIFMKTRSKLDDYSFQRPAWSEEMKGVAESIGMLGCQIGSNWTISRKEVPYYFCLGQSLSGFYLPSKGDENKLNETKGDNQNDKQ